MIRIELEPLHKALDEIESNHRRYYAEMTDGDSYGEWDMDWELYRALSQAGSMACVVMRDKDKLVGFAVFSFGTNPRYKTMMQADNHGLFIEKAYRKYSDMFIKKCIEFMRTIGAHETNFTESDDRVGKWLAKHGAKSTYKIYSFNHAN